MGVDSVLIKITIIIIDVLLAGQSTRLFSPVMQTFWVIGQAGLRSELEVATDEMEKAQQRLAALEKEKEVLQGPTSPTASQAASRPAPNKLVEESLRNELQNQVSPTFPVAIVTLR